jgi:hypothetical protein
LNRHRRNATLSVVKKCGTEDAAQATEPSPPQAALAVTRAVGDRAVLLLDEAHQLLLRARIVAAPPPSRRWVNLLKELARAPAGDQGARGNAAADASVDRLSKSVLNTAAMFLTVEAANIEGQACLLASGDTCVERLEAIAIEVGEMADTLLDHIDNETWRSADAKGSSSDELNRATVRRGGITGQFCSGTVGLVALVVVYMLVGNHIAVSLSRDLTIVLAFVIIPGFVVLKWYLQARRPHRLISSLRTPRRDVEWFDEITHRSSLLDVHANALRNLIRRVDLVAGDVAVERQACESRGLYIAASKLDSLGRQLQDAGNSAKNLLVLITESTQEARRFTATCQRDPREACSEYGRLPLVLDPARIEATIDNLILVLHLTMEVAVDIPLRIQGEDPRISTVGAGRIAEAVVNIFREVQGSNRSLKHECRCMLRVSDHLHRMVVAESIAALERGLASRMAARAAVAASVSTQPRTRRPAARTAFVREASVSENRSWIWIGKASAAAIKRGQKSLVP